MRSIRMSDICILNILTALLLCFTLNVAHSSTNNGVDPPQAKINSGKLEGSWKTSFDGQQYAAFEGIPYAKPPIGHLRFEAPQPIDHWAGTWKATQLYQCPQTSLLSNGLVKGEENCLYLNVFVPKMKKSKRLDVLVHIHGGSFIAGSGTEYLDPKYVMDRDWIFVTMNYRLGSLGFLSTEDDIVPGNNGLKDQNLALKWVKENIANFGGNPDSITLSGFSAGAASVHFHYFSPMSRGLFNRGMSISGTAVNAWAMVENPSEKAKTLAKAVGCDNSDNKMMVNCLKQRPASLIVKKTEESLFPYNPVPFEPFTPVVEKTSNDSFLTDYPYKLLKEGNVFDVPWLTSFTAEEGILFLVLAHKFEDMDKNWTKVAKYVLDYNGTIPHSRESEIANKIKEYYLSNGAFVDESNTDKIIKLFTDRSMIVDAELAAELQSKVTKSPVYLYKFSYEGANSWKNELFQKHIKGTCHGDDMIYFFGGFISNSLTDMDIKLKNICMDILYSYVHEGVPALNHVKWTPIKEKFEYLKINGPNDIRMEIKTDYSANEFWENLGLLENKNIFAEKYEL